MNYWKEEMDKVLYNRKQDDYFKEHEALCKRCGKCCGADTNEPCSNLVVGQDGKFFCRSYANRLGAQRTVSGRIFTCVDIRDVLAKGLPYEDCGYS